MFLRCHDLDVSRALLIVGSYDVLPSLSCDELIFPFEIPFYRIEYFYGFETTWYMSCKWILVVPMGYHSDSLDMCFGTQLADSRGDIGVIYAWGFMHILVVCFSGRNLGALFEVLCGWLNIKNPNLLWCYFNTNSWIDQTERIALRCFRTLQTIYSYVLQ